MSNNVDDTAESAPEAEDVNNDEPAADAPDVEAEAPAEDDQAEQPPSTPAEADVEPEAEASRDEPSDEVAAADEESDEADPPTSEEPAAEPAARTGRGAAKSVTTSDEFVEDGRADQALDFVVDLLTCMRMDCTVDLMENADEDPASDIRIEISGKDADRLIGKKGQTLSAAQFLVNRVVNRPSLPRRHILIDAGGYRARREHALSQMAKRLGQQAVDDGKIITFEPMSAQDRRVVHLALAQFSGVVTKSEGKGAQRRVQIIPVRE